MVGALTERTISPRELMPAPDGTSWASTPSVRNAMKANRNRDTRPEVALRSAVHRLGLRYRVAVRPTPKIRRTADLVFSRARVAVFLDGCYWHGCPEHGHVPRTNSPYWSVKLASNRARDEDLNRALRDAGWEVVRVWEHEEVAAAALRIAALVHERTAP